MNKELELKSHPGRHGNQDDHKYKRTYSLDVRLSPLELTALKKGWKNSDFNSVAAYVRNIVFKGDERKIDLYFEEKREEKLATTRLLSELNKQGKNLNQIAKQLNSKPEFLKQETKLVLKDLENALKTLEEIKQAFQSGIKK